MDFKFLNTVDQDLIVENACKEKPEILGTFIYQSMFFSYTLYLNYINDCDTIPIYSTVLKLLKNVSVVTSCQQFHADIFIPGYFQKELENKTEQV